MKRIVRLTESDLARIVKRVIKEESSKTIKEESIKPIKARVFNKPDDLKNNTPRACNFDITEVELDGNRVEFFYETPGAAKCKVNGVTISNQAYGFATCGDSTNKITMEGTVGYLSSSAFKELTKACEAYASAGNKEDSNYA